MIDISKYSFLKYLLFGSLYFSEGIMMAIGFVIIPVYFVEKGVSLELAGLVIGVATIPVTIKFIWGGIVDYFIRFGRKWFIILGSMLLATATFALIIINPADALIPFTMLLFIAVCGVGFLDVSADAWAIEIGREKERGKISGSMFAGQYSGMAFGSAVLAAVASTFNYQTTFLIAGIIYLVIILFPLIVRESKMVIKREKVTKILINEFKKKQTQVLTALAPLLWINRGMLLLVIPLYMKIGLILDIAQIGLLVALFPVTSAIGSIVGGTVADKWTRKTTLYMFLWMSIIFSASFILADTWIILAVFYGIFGFLQGASVSISCAMYMDVTNPHVGATQFSILTSLGNAGMMAGETISGTLITALGFTRTFLYSAWIFGPSLLLLHFVKRKKD